MRGYLFFLPAKIISMCWIIQVITCDYHSAAWICEWSYLRKNIRIENEVSNETLFCCGGYVLDMKRVGQKGIAGKMQGGRLRQRAAKLQRSRNCCALCLASYNLHLKLGAHWHFFWGAVKFWQTTFNGVGLQFFGVLFCVQQGVWSASSVDKKSGTQSKQKEGGCGHRMQSCSTKIDFRHCAHIVKLLRAGFNILFSPPPRQIVRTVRQIWKEVMISDTWLRGSVTVTKALLLCHLRWEPKCRPMLTSSTIIQESPYSENLRSRLSDWPGGNVGRWEFRWSDILTCFTCSHCACEGKAQQIFPRLSDKILKLIFWERGW